MKTTTATYLVNVTTDDENIITFYKTMPTRPTTSKGIKSQNNKIENWTKLQYPDWTEIDIIPAFEAGKS
jgi:hypothetical protein|tara:strand:+ start:357 stop:563 length:207 start_codon:yes stop_codon:yes gene_type:complete